MRSRCTRRNSPKGNFSRRYASSLSSVRLRKASTSIGWSCEGCATATARLNQCPLARKTRATSASALRITKKTASVMKVPCEYRTHECSRPGQEKNKKDSISRFGTNPVSLTSSRSNRTPLRHLRLASGGKCLHEVRAKRRLNRVVSRRDGRDQIRLHE